MVELSAAVRQKIAPLGEQGGRWLSELPGLVAELEQRWSITVGSPLAGGSAALGPSMDQLGLVPEDMIALLCQALRQAWAVPRPPDSPTQEKAAPNPALSSSTRTGFLADPTYDLGVVLRDWCPQLLAAAFYWILARMTSPARSSQPRNGSPQLTHLTTGENGPGSGS